MRLKMFCGLALALLVTSANSALTLEKPAGSPEGPRYAGSIQARATRAAVTRLPVKIERHAPGAAVVFGVPFPVGALGSPDHVRLLDSSGREVPSQISE